ncbi:MAG: sulfurtransferase complex subunit TusB [Gammaproteobacteria bacterium]|nr:sulfurtransferase complex subunit TusB [Gammaproteobacteria bacterium]
MATLHLINKSPGSSDALTACLRVMAEGDAIVLIEDGVYAALAGGDTAERLRGVASALEADVAARGLQSRLGNGIEQVDDNDFVELCTRCDRVMSWF